MEARWRIQIHQPHYPVDLSEAQLFYCHARSEGRLCEGPNGGWWPDHALRFLANPGVADEACYPYTPGDQDCAHLCADWRTRSAAVMGFHSIGDTDAMKRWIASNGPLVTCFSVYDDFYSYHGGVYHHVTGDYAGGHCVCVVGYDDVDQCWIVKNSWGTGMGVNGYWRIGYGQCGIDHEMWAIEGVTMHKTILHDTAIGAPALADVNDTILALAWTGTDNPHHLNVMGSRDGGRSFAGKVTLHETSFDGPGFAFGNGHAYLAWVGIDAGHHLNVIQSNDCINFGNKVTLGDNSRFGPALAFGNGRLFMAWVGTDAQWKLNVMQSIDGVHWTDKVTLQESSDSAPALAFADGVLYLVWQGTDPNSSLNILESRDGKQWGGKVTLRDSSDFRPALTKHGKLVLGWTGRDSNHHLNTMTSPGALNAFGGKITYGDTASNGVSLMTFKGSVYISWVGTDDGHHLNVMQLP
jgi:Papain family cysteine protease